MYGCFSNISKIVLVLEMYFISFYFYSCKEVPKGTVTENDIDFVFEVYDKIPGHNAIAEPNAA